MTNKSVSDFVAATMDAVLNSAEHKALFGTTYKYASEKCSKCSMSKDSCKCGDSAMADDNEAKKKLPPWLKKKDDESSADDNEAKKKKDSSDSNKADGNADFDTSKDSASGTGGRDKGEYDTNDARKKKKEESSSSSSDSSKADDNNDARKKK